MGEDYKKGGNSVLFGFYLLANIGLTLIGLLLISLGFYSCEVNQHFAENDGSFIVIGIFIEAVSLVGHRIRYSPFYLLVYLVMLFFGFVLLFVFVCISFGKLGLDGDFLPFFKFVLCQTILNIFACFVIALWYWRSLEFENKVPVLQNFEQKVSPFLKR